MLCSQSAIAYNSKFVPDVSRRDWMKKGIIAVAAGMTLNSPESANANKYCAFGTGDGCEDLAEGNEYIRELQARSAANKEAIQLVSILQARAFGGSIW